MRSKHGGGRDKEEGGVEAKGEGESRVISLLRLSVC